MSDQRYNCGMRSVSLDLSKYTTVYGYEFADEDAPGYLRVSFPLGAYHTSEIQYLFLGYQGFYEGKAPRIDDSQRKLSDAMIAYWTTFAKTGKPNADGTPNWPQFNANKERVMALQSPTPSIVTNFAKRHHCDFWDRVPIPEAPRAPN